jgi:TRAP-type C4-dicarboxylate transport system permease small subunit
MRLAAAVDRLAALAALLGGGLILGVVAINAWSILADAAVGLPFAGTFELTEIGVAVAVFLFLPYCQLTGANVTADFFTARLSERGRAGLSVVWAAAALGFSLLLLERMWAGLLDQRAYRLTTTILQVPVWWAFVPILVALALLAAACLVSLARAARAAGRR